MSSGQSIDRPGALTPLPCIRRLQSTSSEMPTSTFFGSHPRSWQVPPNGRESMTATLHPASRHAYATVWAAEPVPITITSTVVATIFPPVWCPVIAQPIHHSVPACRRLRQSYDVTPIFGCEVGGFV